MLDERESIIRVKGYNENKLARRIKCDKKDTKLAITYLNDLDLLIVEREDNSYKYYRISNKGIVLAKRRVAEVVELNKTEEKILKIILDRFTDYEEYINLSDNELDAPIKYQIDDILNKFKYIGLIARLSISDSGALFYLTEEGLSFFEDKDKHIKLQKSKEEQMSKNSTTFNIENLHANQGNVVFGDVINSTLSIDNSLSIIEETIEEKGGEDKQELKDLLDEAKELIENIKESCYIPKNKRFIDKLNNHTAKHGWFYGAVLQLLGAAVLQSM